MNLLDELILLLLNEESGYFHQVPGWNLNCAIASASLAELALLGRIDMDVDHLFIADPATTEDPHLDSILKEIGDEPRKRSTQYWIEYLSPRSEAIMEDTLESLEKRGILIHHSGGFWSLARGTWQTDTYSSPDQIPSDFVKGRIAKVLFGDEIPHPKDAILVALANSCHVLHLIFPLDDNAAQRIDLVCKLDAIGRSIGEATAKSITHPRFYRVLSTKPIPKAPLRDLLFSPAFRTGNVPALFADMARKNGPVFRLNVPFKKGGILFLVGREANRWMQQVSRSYVRSKDCLTGFEQEYGASRILPSMDGTDHFRMRKAIQATYSRAALADRLDELYHHSREHLATWKVGDVLPAVQACKDFTNAQFSQLSVGINTEEDFHDLIKFKERSLIVHVQKVLPKFMLKTPGMKRRKKRIGDLVDRIQAAHTPAQRVGCPQDITDNIMSLHAADPQFLPETDLPFSIISPLIVSLYMGNALSFALYTLLRDPQLYRQIQEESDRVFAEGDPEAEALSKSGIDLTYRFLMESQRLYPIIPMQIRTVMNSCVVEGYELPVGSNIYLVQAATHYMEDIFPDPFSFDIDRYQATQDRTDRGTNYAPFGLGTHKCLGFRWVELNLAVNLLMLLHYFRFELTPANYQLRINPFPTMSPTRKMKIRIAEKRHDLYAPRAPRSAQSCAC
ncbi:MAG: cytochrome P450 [Rhodobacteraceae bacterium]|nr:cytochrome P450 [Paracoccaceae bacterium]